VFADVQIVAALRVARFPFLRNRQIVGEPQRQRRQRLPWLTGPVAAGWKAEVRSVRAGDHEAAVKLMKQIAGAEGIHRRTPAYRY